MVYLYWEKGIIHSIISPKGVTNINYTEAKENEKVGSVYCLIINNNKIL